MWHIIFLILFSSYSYASDTCSGCGFGPQIPLGSEVDGKWETDCRLLGCEFDSRGAPENKSHRAMLCNPCVCSTEYRATVKTCVIWGPGHCIDSQCGHETEACFCRQNLAYSGAELACGALKRFKIYLMGLNAWIGNRDCGLACFDWGVWCCEREYDYETDSNIPVTKGDGFIYQKQNH